MDGDRRCEFVKPDGTPCQAQARPGKLLCTFHDPELAGHRAAGRRAGGVNRSRPAAVLPPGTPDVPLATVADVTAVLATTINQVRRGEVDAKVANCVGVLCGILLKALDGGEAERRLEALEARLTGQAASPRPSGRANGRVAS